MNVWNTKPKLLLRSRVSFPSLNVARSFPSNSTVPDDGRSSAPRICSNVVFPCPVGPWMARNSPSEIERSTSRSATTVARPFR